MTTFKPLLAETVEDISKLRYPLLASPKLDGIRCVKLNGKALTRKQKQAEYHRGWYQRNKDRVAESRKKWREANPGAEREAARRRRAANPMRAREVSAGWRARNRERDRQQSREGHLRRKYGISLAAYEQLFQAQSGRCSVCRRVVALFGRGSDAAHLDHDHASGVIRGFLCPGCNKAIGLIKDNADTALAMSSYLRKHQ